MQGYVEEYTGKGKATATVIIGAGNNDVVFWTRQILRTLHPFFCAGVNCVGREATQGGEVVITGRYATPKIRK